MSRHEQLISALLGRFPDAGVTGERLGELIVDALDVSDFLASLCEAFRISRNEMGDFLVQQGFGDIVSRAGTTDSHPGGGTPDFSPVLLNSFSIQSPFPEVFTIECSLPGGSVNLPVSGHKALKQSIQTISSLAGDDSFFALYRHGVTDYYRRFLATDGKLIDEYLNKNFPGTRPRYLISSGIGANESYCHFMARLYNRDHRAECEWFVMDSSLQLSRLPKEATLENTLFLEFSRSGETQETVKFHEFTPRNAKRIVFANQGPLYELGRRDNNLVLEFPDQVPGRFGRNVTPILMAPLYVLRQDIESLWSAVADAVQLFDLGNPRNLPLQLASFIYACQRANNINHFYITGSGHPALMSSCDELVQLWNEGVNKEGNDMLMCRYFGQPRDSHTVIEGILSNHRTKMALFTIYDATSDPVPGFASGVVDPINQSHAGLRFGQDDYLLTQANYQRFKELMPVIKIELTGAISYQHAIILGQLWQDTVVCYAKILGVDPGSNPEVRAVRDRSEEILSKQNNKSI